jgi:hypothetical protein
MDVNIKSCSNCNAEYEAQVSKCPKCDSEFFILVSPQDSPDSSTDTALPRVPYVRPKSKYEIEEEQRLQHEESMDPDLLAKFKHRFQLELQEIAYLEWRAMQHEWKDQVMKAEKDPKSQAIIGGFVGPRAVTTAAGVYIGTTAIRSEISELNNDDGGGSSGGEEGGISDFIEGLFS